MEADNIEKKLSEMGLQLPTLPTSKGIYKRCVIDNKNLYVSGHISVNNDGSAIKGKLGKDLDEEQGKNAARQCGLAILTSIKNQLGSLDKIKRVIKILGMVNATPEYENTRLLLTGAVNYLPHYGEKMALVFGVLWVWDRYRVM